MEYPFLDPKGRAGGSDPNAQHGRPRAYAVPTPEYVPIASPAELIAPCGMNCALCSRYLARRNGLRRSHCLGCRPRNQTCGLLLERCTGINHGAGTRTAAFCFTCDQFPCRRLRHIDRRYRENYGISFLENLECIRTHGLEVFLAEQQRRHSCPSCGEPRSVHNGKCFRCQSITRLVEKLPDRVPQPAP